MRMARTSSRTCFRVSTRSRLILRLCWLPEPLLDVLTHAPSGDVAAKKVVSAEAKADKDKLAAAFNLNVSVTLTGEANQNLDQDWGFGISADTAILKAITDPDEAAQESFEFDSGSARDLYADADQ